MTISLTVSSFGVDNGLLTLIDGKVEPQVGVIRGGKSSKGSEYADRRAEIQPRKCVEPASGALLSPVFARSGRVSHLWQSCEVIRWVLG
jgi:hypothetical protein